MSGDIKFEGTQEEWDALVKRNKQTMAQQTALDWYIDIMNQWFDDGAIHCGLNKEDKIYIQAKAMEKEQIMDAYNAGESDGDHYEDSSLIYYIDTFKIK
jgi:hypothetical protein